RPPNKRLLPVPAGHARSLICGLIRERMGSLRSSSASGNFYSTCLAARSSSTSPTATLSRPGGLRRVCLDVSREHSYAAGMVLGDTIFPVETTPADQAPDEDLSGIDIVQRWVEGPDGHMELLDLPLTPELFLDGQLDDKVIQHSSGVKSIGCRET